MALPGISDEKELKLLLKKLLASQDEVFKFAIVAHGPKEGELLLSKKEKLKKKEVQAEAEAEAKKNSGGKAAKIDVITGECRLHKPGGTTLRLVVYGKAISKAVACAEHLLARGPYKTVGFTEVVLEEVEEPSDTPPTAPTAEAPPTAPSEKSPATDLEADAQQKAYLGEREKLAPALAKAQQERPDKATALQKVWDFAESQFQAGSVAAARKALAGLATSLAGGVSTGPSTTGGDDLERAFVLRRDQMESDLLAARKADPEKGSKLLQVWDYAQGRADAGDFATAMKALDGLDATLKKVLAEAPKTDTERFGVRAGIVAERRKELAAFFQQRVEKAKKQADADVRKLTKALDEHLENSQELTAAINKELHRIYEGFAARIDKAIDAGVKDEVVDVLDSCRKEFAANKLIGRLGDAGSELGVDMEVVKEIGDLFNDAEDQVASLSS